MLLRSLLLGTFALGSAAMFLPRAESPADSAAPGVTRSEMQLITSLRALAQVPEGAATELPLRREVAAVDAAPPVVPVADDADEAAERMIVTSSALNLRAEPSSDAEVLGRLLEGDAVEVAGRDGGWVEVATADGATGWAYSDYLAVATQSPETGSGP